MRRLVVTLINLYQQTLSPDHGWRHRAGLPGACRFYPSCSEYTKQAIVGFGVVRGTWLGLKRIIRCHPWSRGGVDHVPAHV